MTPAEVEALLTLHGRRNARRAARQSGGRRAARLTKELQREQVALAVDLTRSRGATTAEIARHRARIAFIREALRKLETRPPPRVPIG